MAYDPRPEILALFTNSKVSGTGKYKTEYVEVCIRDRNPSLRRTYKTSKGIIALDPPIAPEPHEKAVNGTLFCEHVIINCQMFIPMDSKINYQVDEFINDIVHSFEDTIVDNRLTTVSNAVMNYMGCDPVPSKSGKNHRRIMKIRVRKYQDYA